MGCAHQEQQQAPVIRDLSIEGTHAVAPRQIKKKILSSKTGWWPFAHKEYFDPVTWEADLKRIVRLYVSRGFYQARVAHEAVTPDGKDGVALKVAVEEGQPTHVGSVQVTGLDALPPADQQAARSGLTLRPGQVFDEGNWESSKSGIVAALRARGYYRAAAAGEALVGQTSHQAELNIVVRPGRAVPVRGHRRQGWARRAHPARAGLGSDAAGHRRWVAVQRRGTGRGAAPRVRDGGLCDGARRRRARPTKRPPAFPSWSPCARRRSGRCAAAPA